MKCAVELNEKGRKNFLAWVGDNCQSTAKFDDGELFAPEAWLEDFNDRLSEDSSIREYEMSSTDSQSGNPELFRFDDSDLVFEEIQE